MTRKIINVGVADKGNGDPIRVAFSKANDNFAELYNILSNNTGGSIITTDVIGSVFADDSTLLVDGINGSIPYSVLSGAPTIPAAQVQSNWTASSGMGVILNKPTLFSGSYTDLTSKPTIPTLVSQLANDSGFLTSVGNISNIRSEGNVNIDINLSDSTLRRWQFGEDGDTVFPNNVSINYSGNNVQFPRIIADSGKAFSVQGQGNSGSTALAWTVNPDAASQYAAVSVSRAGGDNLAKVVLQAQSNSGDAGTAKTWKFNETGILTLPAGGTITEGGGFTGAIKLTPSGGANEYQALLIYPTAGADGDHIHLTAAGGTTELYLGSDNHYVKLASGGVVRIQADDGVASSAAWVFGTNGSLTFPDSTVQTTAARPFSFSVAADDSTQRAISNNESIKFTGAGGVTTASDAEGNITITGSKVIGSWTVTNGTSTYSFTLPSDGTYVMWVKGNIANGIITWNATASVTNTNVPAIGSQYAWNYTGGGSPILLTAIPDQIRGSAGTISTDATYAGTTSNRFDFGISNTTGSSQTVYYGYTKIS